MKMKVILEIGLALAAIFLGIRIGNDLVRRFNISSIGRG